MGTHRRRERLDSEVRGRAAVEHRQQRVDVADGGRLVKCDGHLRANGRLSTLQRCRVSYEAGGGVMSALEHQHGPRRRAELILKRRE